MSPDGRAADEIAVTCAVDHPALIKVVGGMAEPHALVVVRVSYLALKLLVRCNRSAHHLRALHVLLAFWRSKLWSQVCRFSEAEQVRAVERHLPQP